MAEKAVSSEDMKIDANNAMMFFKILSPEVIKILGLDRIEANQKIIIEKLDALMDGFEDE